MVCESASWGDNIAPSWDHYERTAGGDPAAIPFVQDMYAVLNTFKSI